jgi:hypothetical protein
MAKSTKSSDSSTASTGVLPAWAPAALWGMALGGIAAGLVVWVPRLVQRTADAPLPSPVRVVLRDEPRWLPKDERAAIERSVVKSIAANPFDRDGLVAARDAVVRSGWMTSVAQVRRSDVDEVIVEGTWAVPFALVCDADGEHLVDARGRLLPRSYPAGKGPRLLRIKGVDAPRPTEFGGTWRSDEVASALAMAATVVDRPWRWQIAGVDMSGWSEDGLIRLQSDRGCTIVWGRAPGKETAAEVPAMQKIAALQAAFDRTGHVDGGARENLDLRGDVTVGH